MNTENKKKLKKMKKVVKEDKKKVKFNNKKSKVDKKKSVKSKQKKSIKSNKNKSILNRFIDNVTSKIKKKKKISKINSIKTRKELLKIHLSKDYLVSLFNYIQKQKFTTKLKSFKGYRIFFLSVHGVNINKNIINKGMERLNYHELLKPYNMKAENLTIITPQSFGRLSINILDRIFFNNLNSKFMKLLISGLINMKNKKEIDIMNFLLQNYILN